MHKRYVPAKNSPLSTYFILLPLDFKKLEVCVSYQMNTGFFQQESNHHAGCTTCFALFPWYHTQTLNICL